MITSNYRPFIDKFAYFDESIIENTYQIPSIFPNKDVANYLIAITGIGAKNGFNVLALNKLPDLNLLEGGAQCFPMYIYTEQNLNEGLFANNAKDNNEFKKENAITDFIKSKFDEKYKKNIKKNDIFYYTFGILNSSVFIEKFENNLSKELPRIPITEKFKNFELIKEIGRNLFKIQISDSENHIYEFENEEEIKSKFEKINQISSYKIKKDTKNKKFSITINNTIKIDNIEIECLSFENKGKSIIENFLSFAKLSINKDNKIIDNIVDFHGPLYVYKKIKNILYISLKTSEIKKELSKITI